MRWAKVQELVGEGHIDWGIKNDVLTIAGPAGSLSIPWPAPEPKDGYGSWQPVVMERFPDGTALGLWRWEVGPLPGTTPWLRADRPPHLNVPPWRDLLPPLREHGAHVDEVLRDRDDWGA